MSEGTAKPDTERLRLKLEEARQALKAGKWNGEIQALEAELKEFRSKPAVTEEGPIDYHALAGATPLPAQDFFPTVEDSVDYLIEPIVIRKGLTEIHGEPKSGKSCFSLLMGICAATGRLIPGEFITVPKPIRVLYIPFEDGPRRLKRRTLDYMGGLGLEGYPENLVLWDKPDLNIGSAVGSGLLKSAIQDFKIDLTFLDTLSHVHRADENSAAEMKEVMAGMTRLCRETDSGIAYVHHSSKGSGENSRSAIYKGRGSSAIVAAADMVLDWGRPENNVTRCEFISKDDESQTWDVHYEKCDEGVRWHMTVNEKAAKRSVSHAEALRTMIELEALNPAGVSVSTIADACHLSKRHMQRVLDSMVAKHAIGFYSTKNRKQLYKIIKNAGETSETSETL